MWRCMALLRTDLSENISLHNQGGKKQRARNSSSSSVLQLLVTANVVTKLADSFYRNDEGDTFLRNVDSYKSHSITF
jgi:hypothetical protein